ncbi:MAG TPA: signal recognition particle protein [Peptococcaceae bacterium]|nr:MAG: Signal recognition particle protein [Clostridia bacterium 41_269]HBT20017.1 signal recognition particle protein [Peptococcaceae bacterium]
MPILSNLSEKIQQVFKKLKGKGKLTEKDIEAALREIRLALLEADVNYKVVKEFISKIKNKAMGHEVLESLTPAQQVIKIVNDELTELMGGSQSKIELADSPPTVIMLVGLQGSGKTTTAGKLALHMKKSGYRPILVAADVYRPAAVKQLHVVGEKSGVPVFDMGTEVSPVEIAQKGIKHAKASGFDIVLIDTAGRLHIDKELMDELVRIKDAVLPNEILLVVDAMTGQDAVNVAEAFYRELNITGVILSKLDGDARGGAALSVKAVTGCPIKYVGVGEKLDALEPFHPERMASRILGMGDVLTLIEKAQQAFDQDKAKELERKIKQRSFDLEDFLEQLKEFRNMGPLEEIFEMIPGMNKFKNLQLDEKELIKAEAIIQSMTKEERANPEIINSSRKRRIAMGSGTTVQDVNRLLKQFSQVQMMINRMGAFSGKKKGRKMKLPNWGFPPFI